MPDFSKLNSGDFLPSTMTHGRGAVGRTGHLVCAKTRVSLCGVEKRAPHLDLEVFELDELEDKVTGRTLRDWMLNGQAALCHTCTNRALKRAGLTAADVFTE